MSKIFMTEKPSQAQDIAKALAKEGDVIIVIPSIAGYKFKYPDNITPLNFPFLNDSPKYKVAEASLLGFPFKQIKDSDYIDVEEISSLKLFNLIHEEDVFKEEVELERKKLLDYFKSFDEVVIANDPDHSGTRGFDLYVCIFLNEFITNFHKKISRIMPNGMSDECLKKAFASRSLIEESLLYKNTQNYYRNKDFFNYNFNVNSSITFDGLLKRNGWLIDKQPLTYNMIQSLMLIDKPLTDGQLIKALHDNEIGSPASKGEIVGMLFKYKLIRKTDKKSYITKLGKILLDSIPYEKNIDNFELIKDYEMPEIEFKEKYTEKIKNYFEAQNNKIKKGC